MGKGLDCKNQNIKENAEKIFGLRFMISKNRYEDGLIKYMGDILDQGRELIVQVDNYHCPWDAAYHKKHFPHTLIVVGYTDTSFLCVNTLPKKNVELPYVDFVCALISLIEIGKSNKADLSYVDKKLVKHIRKHVHCSQLKKFYRDLSKQESLIFEYVKDNPIWRQPLYQQICAIYGGDISFRCF